MAWLIGPTLAFRPTRPSWRRRNHLSPSATIGLIADIWGLSVNAGGLCGCCANATLASAARTIAPPTDFMASVYTVPELNSRGEAPHDGSETRSAEGHDRRRHRRR